MIQEPVEPTPTQTRPARPPGGGRRSGGQIGLVIVACLVLAAPVVAVIAASSPKPPTSAAGASNAPTSTVEPSSGHGNGHGLKWKDGPDPKGGKGQKGNGGPGNGPISIGAINGSNVSLETEDGWTRTIAVTDTTVITKAGQRITVGDLKVGNVIRFHQVRNADGTFTVEAIDVPTPSAGGEVTSVDANTITVKKGGSTRVIAVTGSTVYTLGSAAGTKSDVKVGSDIEAQGTLSAGTFTATTVKIELPHITGLVTAKTGDTITVKKGDGSTATIHVSKATTYEVKGKDGASLSDVAVGDRASAEGTLRADGSLDAVSVQVKSPKGDHPNGDDDDDAASSPAPG